MQASSLEAKFTLDEVVPPQYSLKQDKSQCPFCDKPCNQHQPEDIFLNSGHVGEVRDWLTKLDTRQGRNFQIVSAIAMETPSSVLTEREILDSLRDLWINKGADYANQYQFLLNYWATLGANKWNWDNLAKPIDQARIHYDALVEWFEYQLHEIARLNNLNLELKADAELAATKFHERFVWIADQRYKELRKLLQELEGRVIRATQQREALAVGTEFSEDNELKRRYNTSRRESEQKSKPMEKTVAPQQTAR